MNSIVTMTFFIFGIYHLILLHQMAGCALMDGYEITISTQREMLFIPEDPA
jgi:hypothetical protein